MGVLDFLSKEAGQARRRALDERIAGVLDRVGYYAGPELSEFGRGLLQVGGMLNPVQDVGNAMAAGRDGRWGDMAVDVATVVAPVAAGKAAKAINPNMADDAAQWLQDALTGLSVNPTRAGLGDAGQAVVDRMNQPGPVPTMYSNPIMKAADDVDQTRIAIHKSSEDFSDIDLTKSADGTFWLASPDADWSNIVTTGKGFEHKFEVSPNAKLATWDDIDRYSVDELEALGFDGVMMDDGGGDVSYQIWNTDVLNRIANPTKPLTEAEQQAQGVLDLLTSGRANEVTDDMLAAADDRYLFQNYDLPMDEASRMARAREMGFDTSLPLYHGTDSWKIDAFDPKKGMEGLPATFFSDSRDVAMSYGDIDEYFSRIDYPADFDFYGGSRIDFNNKNVTPGGLVRQVKQVIDDTTKYGADTESDLAFDLQSAGIDPWYADEIDAVRMRNVVDSFGWGGNPANNLAVFDPAKIRRTNARFDPRLKHLRNLSAAGLLGLPLLPQDEQPQQTPGGLL